MRKTPKPRLLRALLCVFSITALAGAAYAELQNVEVGGELRIRGRYYMNTYNGGNTVGPRLEVRIPNQWLTGRPIGANGTDSLYQWNSNRPDWHFYESAVLLNVKADFTDDVNAYIEFYDFYQWGEDFRSNYITGADSRGNSRVGQNVEVNQAYIETENTFGMPLRVRIGRQALKFGKGWLVNEMLTPTQRLSFDAIRATYDVDDFTVDAFAAKLAESGLAEEDGDVDFYGVYATYKGLDFLELSGYYFLLRDARSRNDTNFTWFPEAVENFLGVDDYDVTNLNTVGLRANGKASGFDYGLELAYQFGDADAHGSSFATVGGTYGDNDASYSTWAGELSAGYTFEDVKWTPRLYFLGSYFGGEDNRDVSWAEWLNPFDRPEASVSFNRLFSDTNYLPVINDNGWLSNFMSLALGAQFKPTEQVIVNLQVAKAWVVEPFDYPAMFRLGRFYVPIFPALAPWTEEGDDDLGYEVAAWVKYNYTEDLSFMLYYAHLFPGDGLTRGSFIQYNGTQSSGGTGDEDADYIFWMTTLKF